MTEPIDLAQLDGGSPGAFGLTASSRRTLSFNPVTAEPGRLPAHRLTFGLSARRPGFAAAARACCVLQADTQSCATRCDDSGSSRYRMDTTAIHHDRVRWHGVLPGAGLEH